MGLIDAVRTGMKSTGMRSTDEGIPPVGGGGAKKLLEGVSSNPELPPLQKAKKNPTDRNQGITAQTPKQAFKKMVPQFKFDYPDPDVWAKLERLDNASRTEMAFEIVKTADLDNIDVIDRAGAIAARNINSNTASMVFDSITNLSKAKLHDRTNGLMIGLVDAALSGNDSATTIIIGALGTEFRAWNVEIRSQLVWQLTLVDKGRLPSPIHSAVYDLSRSICGGNWSASGMAESLIEKHGTPSFPVRTD